MAKKYKINDGSSKYVEQATLLEPANNSAANQNELEEIREVSFQLAQIKKKHDEAKKLGNLKQEELNQIRKEIDQLYVQEIQSEGPTQEILSKKDMLKSANVDMLEQKIPQELFTQHSYEHMLARMKKDFIAAKIQSSEYHNSLKNKQQILELEQQKQRKIKEERLQSKAIFEGLMRNIEKEQKDRQERIHELQKCIRNKEESVQKRIERQKRNQEIAEAAANENKDSSELKMRENLFIQKLWNSFMRKKMEKEMRESAQIDEAFKSIKTATGVTDVQEMVKKFLTREQTYSHLLVNVSESERKTDKLKKDNDELRARLHDLKIDSESHTAEAGEKQYQDEDIVEMQAKIANQKKDFQILQEKYKKINIVNDQISGWAKRVYGKFATLTDDPTLQKAPGDMIKVFEAMESITVSELKTLKDKADESRVEPDDAFIDLDFQTEDFIHKNIRVRPISGVTHGDDTKDGRASNISKGGAQDESEEALDNYNKLAIYEIENQRKLVKKKAEQFQEELKRKQALEEKKAQKK